MMSKLTVSVVIPTYNEEKYIGSCLASLTNQTDPPEEIIVVDNNCQDNTVKIAQRFGVKIVYEKEQGIVYSRDKGFNSARSQIIARCDADVIVPPSWISRIKYNFQNYQIDALAGLIQYYDIPIQTSFYSSAYMVVMKTLQNGESLIGANMAISALMWNKIRNQVCRNEKKIHEDIDLSLHIIDQGGVIRRDSLLVVQTCARRIKNQPSSFFIEYPTRTFRNIMSHRLESGKRKVILKTHSLTQGLRNHLSKNPF